MRVVLSRKNDDGSWSRVGSYVTNANGRTDAPMLEGESMVAGCYMLEFYVADYFRELGTVLPNPPFLDIVPLVVGLADPQAGYHVPLLCSPWSYSTYRGS